MAENTSELRWAKKYPWLGTNPVPVEPCISPEFYERELERVFKKSWLMVGRVEELPKPHCYKLKKLEFAKTGVIIIRGKDDQFRAFHNTCAHRGNTVITPPRDMPGLLGRSRLLTCHFHAWSYNERGELVGVPEENKFSPCFDRKSAGLTPIHCDVWEGFIFINLDDDPKQTLREFLGDFGDLYAGYPYAQLSNEHKWHTHLNTNWKIGVDAFSEAYHVTTIHAHPRATFPKFISTSLDSVELFEQHRSCAVMNLPEEKRQDLPTVMGMAFGKAMDASLAQKGTEKRLPAQLQSEDENLNFYIGTVFPNTLIHLSDGLWFLHQFWPVGHDRCLWEGSYYMREPESHSERWGQEYLAKLQRNTWLEDTATMEDTFDALASGAKTHFHLQDEEILIRHNYHVLENSVSERSG